MADEQTRGSEKLWQKLFESDAPDGKALAAALGAAESDFIVKRWWKYGQPAIDLIKGVLDVRPEQAAGVFNSLIQAHGEQVQVGFEVFPYGIVAPDGLEVNVQFENNVGR